MNFKLTIILPTSGQISIAKGIVHVVQELALLLFAAMELALRPCPKCNLLNDESSRFCVHCGQSLITSSHQLLPPTPRYLTPPQRRQPTVGSTRFVVFLLIVACVAFIWRVSSIGSEKSSDSLSKPLQNEDQSVPASAPQHVIDYWGESEHTSEMDGTRTIDLTRTSNEEFQGWLESHTPILAVQCYTRRRPDVFVDIGSAASVEYDTDLHTVRLRLDGGSPVRQYWSPSKNGDALFSPNPSNLIAQLKKHNTLLFEFDPFNTPSKATVSFNLSGLTESMAEHPECRTQ